MTTLHKLDYPSPIGVLEIIGTEEAIRSIMFAEREVPLPTENKEEVPQVL